MFKNVVLTFSMGVFLFSSVMFTACQKESSSPDADPAPTQNDDKDKDEEAGIVSGTVVDSQGKPIAGARVRIENDFTYYDVTTNTQGKYKSPRMPAGGFKAVAWATLPYKGQKYTLRMGMPQAKDYDHFDPKKGAVRNFRWQISGRIPDREATGGEGFFGGTVRLSNGTGSIYDERMNAGDQVRVTLTPTGLLIDGSTGKTIEQSFSIRSGNEASILVDIPAGEYRISAVRVTPQGAQEPVLIGTFSEQWEAAVFTFQPGTYGVGTYESGLADVSLYMTLQR